MATNTVAQSHFTIADFSSAPAEVTISLGGGHSAAFPVRTMSQTPPPIRWNPTAPRPDRLNDRPYHGGNEETPPDLSGHISGISIQVLETTSSSIFTGFYGREKVALKVLKALRNDDRATVIKRAHQEMRIWLLLDCKNIIPFYGYDNTFANSLAGAMIYPWYENGHARHYICAKRLGLEARVDLLLGASNGLIHLHDQEIIHGDPKPENLLIDEKGVARLADFGMSHFSPKSSKATSEEISFDPPTPRYCAPELLTLEPTPPRTTKASDVYSLGSVALEFIFELRPYSWLDKHFAITLAVANGEKPAKRPESVHNPHMWDIVERCWKSDPGSRPSASEFKDLIGSLRAGLDQQRSSSVFIPRGQSARVIRAASSPGEVEWKPAEFDKTSLRPTQSERRATDSTLLHRSGTNNEYNANLRLKEPAPHYTQVYTMELIDGVPNISDEVRRTTDAVFVGNYSSVYRGDYDGQEVAIKVILRVGDEKTMKRKVRRERSKWWELVHPNILPLYGFVEGPDFGLFGAMISPWCKYGSAISYLKKNVEPIRRVNLWLDVAHGLAFLHGRDFIHGDSFYCLLCMLTNSFQANILVDEFQMARICDFGLVRQTGTVKSGMTTTSPHTGTTRYLSYELVSTDGRSPPTDASDVHALGCVGLYFLYRQPPYFELGPIDNVTDFTLRKSIIEGTPPSSRIPDAANGEMTTPISTLWEYLERCWNTEPAKRPTAAEICRYLALRGVELARAFLPLPEPQDRPGV